MVDQIKSFEVKKVCRGDKVNNVKEVCDEKGIFNGCISPGVYS